MHPPDHDQPKKSSGIDIRIIEDYIKAIDASHFQAFCDRLLITLFPGDYTTVRAGGPKGDMKNDGYCVMSGKFFQAHASRGESISNIKNKIKTDLTGCVANWGTAVKSFIYITNDTQVGDVENFVDGLRNIYKHIQIETWGPGKLSNMLRELPYERIEYIIERKFTIEEVNVFVKNNPEDVRQIIQVFLDDKRRLKVIIVCENLDSIKDVPGHYSLNDYYKSGSVGWMPFKCRTITELLDEFEKQAGYRIISLMCSQLDLSDMSFCVQLEDILLPEVIIISDALLLSDENSKFMKMLDYKKEIGGMIVPIDLKHHDEVKDFVKEKIREYLPRTWARVYGNWSIPCSHIEIGVSEKVIFFRRLSNLAKNIGFDPVAKINCLDKFSDGATNQLSVNG